MKANGKKIPGYLPALLCIIFFSLASYFLISFFPPAEEAEDTWADSGFLKAGHHLTIQNADNQLSLLDSKDVLSANGLYYITWTIGDSQPYENSDGDTVDLYDAQLYLCLGEYKSDEEAVKNKTKWLEAGKGNYQVLAEEEIVRGGQTYSLITYNCISEENPYARGISAFGVYESTAVCLELTCQENFDQDLRPILLSFLDNCSYSSD